MIDPGERLGLDPGGPVTEADSVAAIQQVRALCQAVVPMRFELLHDRRGFRTVEAAPKGHQGLLSISGEVVDDFLQLKFEILRGPETLRVLLDDLFGRLGRCGEARILPPEAVKDALISYHVGLRVRARPLSLVRSTALSEKIAQLNQLARDLQGDLAPADDTDLEEIFAELGSRLDPVRPWLAPPALVPEPLHRFTLENLDLLNAGVPLAMVAPPSVADLALALMAEGGRAGKQCFARLKTRLSGADLLELVRGTPAIVMVSAGQLGNVGHTIYDANDEIKALLSGLRRQGRPIVVDGTYGELQAVLHGGQGFVADPLCPCVRYVPKPGLELLARFTVHAAVKSVGGASQARQEKLAGEVLEGVSAVADPDERARLLPQVAGWVVRKSVSAARAASTAPVLASTLAAARQTLGGMPPPALIERSAAVQARFVEVLSDEEGLLAFLTGNLLAQDEALGALIDRLCTEALTRPLHQPVRFCAFGTPATGKSASVGLIAQRLGLPLEIIDASNLPSYEMAATTLLGSGRGFVGSNQKGRLEEVAQLHTVGAGAGAVVEVCDLDHAGLHVRPFLADLFLQILETGCATSGQGVKFSCANLIFAFTMNLPGGADETVQKGVGFCGAPDDEEVSRKVAKEIASTFSSAFLSRVGKPIIFRPLDSGAAAVVVERAIQQAVGAATLRLNCRVGQVVVAPGMGTAVIERLGSRWSPAFGARLLLEHGRALASRAVAGVHRSRRLGQSARLRVMLGKDGELELQVEN